MIRIEVEVKTNDPGLRDYVLGDIETWKRTDAAISVSVSEEDEWSGGTRVFSSSTVATFRAFVEPDAAVEGENDEAGGTDEAASPGATASSDVHIDEPSPHPRLLPLPDAAAEVGWPIYLVPSLLIPADDAEVRPRTRLSPESVVVTHGVMDDRGRHRGNVWVTSSPSLLPTSRFEQWRTVGELDVSEDRSAGYYRCKVRSCIDLIYVTLETTAHRTLDDVIELAHTLAPYTG